MNESGTAAFALLALILVVTPGSDTALLLRNVAKSGLRGGVATILGSRIGLVVHATAAAVGFSAILQRSAEIFAAVKMAGAIYLVWLGLQAIFSAHHPQLNRDDIERRRSAGNPWLEGLLTNILNPKTAIFYLAVLPQFAGVSASVWRFAGLAGVHIAISLIWYFSLAAVMASSVNVIARPQVRKMLSTLSGGLLVGFGLKLALGEK